MSRAVEEWIGKTDDSAPPPRVKLRVFEAYGGRCYVSGRKIMPGDKWALDHIQALINGGANRERNLAPILEAPHKIKTASDVKIKAKVYRTRCKHLGIKSESGAKIKGRGFDKSLSRSFSGKVTRRDVESNATRTDDNFTPGLSK